MDVKVDSQFQAFSQKLGNAPSDTKPDELHVEISSGFIPHVVRPRPAATMAAWPDLSAFNMAGFQPGFAHPEVGDPVLVAGRYILDCGHPDFHTELHPVSFLAWVTAAGRPRWFTSMPMDIATRSTTALTPHSSAQSVISGACLSPTRHASRPTS